MKRNLLYCSMIFLFLGLSSSYARQDIELSKLRMYQVQPDGTCQQILNDNTQHSLNRGDKILIHGYLNLISVGTVMTCFGSKSIVNSREAILEPSHVTFYTKDSQNLALSRAQATCPDIDITAFAFEVPTTEREFFMKLSALHLPIEFYIQDAESKE